MGHIGVKGLRSAVEGLSLDDSTHTSCRICATANIKRSPFPQKATHRATRPLQRIHSDICGPLPPAYGSYRYFILFICCHSRYISLYLLKSREEAPQRFIDFCSAAETSLQQKITILRVDNAPELTRGKLAEFCNAQGITYEKTVPDSPNQNGVAERCNLTLASMVRALLIDSDLSAWFWPFAIQTAIHLKNRVPHSSLPPHVTPFELWHNYKPNLSHLCPFGAHCTSRILPTPSPKFAPRGESGRFLGYATHAKGYLIWVPGTNGGGSVKTRRDVSFHDFPTVGDTNRAPLWETTSPPKLPKHLDESLVLLWLKPPFSIKSHIS
jgi:hypothetical protein